uniref:Uncharacterized protein n=1 Tax=Picea glauca TaxID=3330 RepID=A0A101M3R7_PICGL|nr:hypothetical protein ABT39_MTgene298 [Picea glauca]
MPLGQVLAIKGTSGYSFAGMDSDRGSVWDVNPRNHNLCC